MTARPTTDDAAPLVPADLGSRNAPGAISNQPASESQASKEGPSLVIALAVASALFMDLMDSSALATALPTLARVFQTDPFTLKLALTAYLITVAVLVPASGWLSNRYGAKRTFMIAMAIFVLGSTCCGLANSFSELVGARILQGVGGSMMTPVGRSIVVATSPQAVLVKSLAWFTLPAIVGPLAGPPLAGLILAVGSWRYIFLINVPVGIIGLCVVARLVPPLPAGKSDRFDWKGFVLIATAITSIMLLIETGGADLGAVRGSGIILTSVGLIAGMLYFRYAMREKAIVDLRLLRRDTLAVSIGATWVQRMALGATPFLLPLLLQSAMGFSALAASQVMTALAVGGLAARFFVPTIVRKFGFRLAGLTMAATNAVMSALPAFFYMDTPLVWMMVAVAVSSLTRGLFFIMTQTLAYADVTKDEVGHVSVLYTVAQQLSYGLGVTVAAWLLHLEAGTAPLTVADFHLPFLVMSAIAATSILAFLPLRADAGDALSGRPDDEVIVD